MTHKIQISAKENDGTIYAVGGDDYKDFSAQLLELGLDVDAVVARFSALVGLGPEPGEVRQQIPGTTHVQSQPEYSPHNSGSVAPPPPSYGGGPPQSGGQKYSDRHYFHIGPQDQGLRAWAKGLGARFDKDAPGDNKWYVSEKFTPPQQVNELRAHFKV